MHHLKYVKTRGIVGQRNIIIIKELRTAVGSLSSIEYS